MRYLVSRVSNPQPVGKKSSGALLQLPPRLPFNALLRLDRRLVSIGTAGMAAFGVLGAIRMALGGNMGLNVAASADVARGSVSQKPTGEEQPAERERKILPVPELARRTGLSEQTILEAIEAGDIPAKRMDGMTLASLTVVRRYVDYLGLY